jgi:transposase-like protein
MPRGQPTPDDIRQEAIQICVQHGLNEAARRTGLPRSSIRLWTTQAGHDLSGLATERTRAALEAARETRKTKLAEAEDRAITLLTIVRDIALQQTIDRIRTGQMDPHSLIGAWRSATHDLNLLTGQATERAEQTAINIDVQITARTQLIEQLDAMARRMTIDLPPAPTSNGHTNGEAKETDA